MKKFSDYPLKLKLLLVPIVATMCFAAYLIYSSLVLSTGNALLKEFRDTDFPILDAAEKNLNNNDRLVDALNTAAATGEVDYLDVAKVKASEILNRYETLKKLDIEHKNEIEKLTSGFNAYFALALDVAQRMATRRDMPSAQLIMQMRKSRDAYLSGAAAYREVAEKDFHNNVSNAIERSERAQEWGLAIGTLMLFVIAALTFLVTRGILALEKGVADRNKMLATVNSELEHEIQKLKVAEEAKIHAEATSQIKDEFLANMSHEIRTPMNAIIGLTQLTLDSDLSSKQRDHLRMVHTSSRSLLRILDDILDYSKIEAGKLALEQVEFHLEDVVKSVSELFSAKLAEKSLELFIEIDCDIHLNLVGDPLRLGQILNNLIGNAIKFTEHGEIHLKVETLVNEDDKIRLLFSVRDTGIGMDKTQAHRLFNAFSQADSSITRKYGGTGLGLTISKQLVEMMGGDIALTSAPGVGSTFSFSVCLGKGSTNSNHYLHHEIHGVRALIVDDQETSLVVLEHYLEIWQFDVTGTTSGEDALDLIALADHEGRPYEILLVDWRMPGMDGLELTRLVQAEANQGKLKHAPTVIMVTAYDREALFNEAGSTHLNTVLVKPVTPSALYESLLHIQHPQLAAQETKRSAQKVNLKDRRIDLLGLTAPIRGARILLVEDNDINQEVATAFLHKAGLVTTVANHGGEAVEWVQKETFDAVLMDLQMPVMDGFMATELIRKLPQGKDLPIIALSAAAMIQDRQASERAGMNDHVSKPLDPVQLIMVLLKWIKPRRDSDPIQNVGNFAFPATDSLPEELPGFDLRRALMRLGGNQELLIKLLLRFATDYSSVHSQVDELLRENQGVKAAALLHRINGAASSLGATSLSEAAQQLETEIKSGGPLNSQNAFAQHLDEAVKAIKSHIPPSNQKERSPHSSPNTAIVESGFANLAARLKNHEMPEDDQLEQLLSSIAGPVSARLISELEGHLHNFDFESSSATLTRVVEEWQKNYKIFVSTFL